jgi:hypothetical protein
VLDLLAEKLRAMTPNTEPFPKAGTGCHAHDCGRQKQTDAMMGRFWSVIELALKRIDDAPVRAVLANAEAKGGA